MKALFEVERFETPAAAAKAAEPDWFSDFYRSHANFVRHLMLGLGAQSSEAEDLVQEVFLVAYRKWPHAANATQADARNWLYGVIVRVIGQERRRQRIRAFFRLGESRVPEDHSTPATAFEGMESLTVVHRLLDSVSESKRTVFVLFELEGLSGQQIAKILRLPLQTVWNRLFHARKAFLKALTRENLREQRETGDRRHG